MQRTAQILSDLAFYRTYSQVKSDGTKESWKEVVERYQQFMLDQFPTQHHDLITKACTYVRNRMIVPSMRMLQFAGEGLARENMRAYNCSFVAVQSFKDFADIFYVLMNGTGVGFSVQKHHTSSLPVIEVPPQDDIAFIVVGDSREGWAESIIELCKNPNVNFDYSQIRLSGAKLSTGGTASGPESLRRAHENIRRILCGAEGRKLRPIEVHDIVCHIADVVVVGGVRRAALISLFDQDEEEMMLAKAGAWWERNSQRARANNSAVLIRGKSNYVHFRDTLRACIGSNSGEPGIFWTSDKDYGTNPCAEISLQSQGLCNLTEINAAVCETEFDFTQAAYYATVLGTFQAALTNFHYVSPRWKQVAEQEALLGVSITGQAQNWENLKSWGIADTADMTKLWNYELASQLGINPAARITTTKPSGTTSTVLGTTAGIHGAYAPHYLRRVRIAQEDPLSQYLASNLPSELIEVDQFQPSLNCIALPIKMDGIVASQETCVEQLERAKYIQKNWIKPGHNRGPNTHNVSLTCYYRAGTRDEVELDVWMWNNRDCYAGISLLPLDTNTYIQAPYEAIDEAKYEELNAKVLACDLDLSAVQYEQKHDTRSQTSGCEGDKCSIL
jgi:ribonucleoside-diphosphate reductase alpha chain